MKISEVKAGTNATVSGEVTNMDEPREVVTKFGKKMRVASATLKDDSGEMVLSLWNDDIEKVQVGAKVTVENGWVAEYKGNLQISAGKFGKLNVQ
ncbi:DNA-binding protein [Candidatus Parvarchaeota archaeon]|nr:DNA-binding protein [Candidatus Parvarchaeota archaeon]